MRTRVLLLFALPLAMGAAPAAAEEEPRLAVGVRANALGGTGEPTNDVLGAGVYGRVPLHRGWFVGFAVDTASGFDVERIAGLTGLTQDPNVKDIDATASSTAFTAWIERAYPRRRVEWFWTAGAGLSAVDIDDATGPLAGGGVFDIETDAGTEALVAASGGARWHLGRRWDFELALRLEQHFADWTLRDRVSGAAGTVDDYTLRGVHFAFAWGF